MTKVTALHPSNENLAASSSADNQAAFCRRYQERELTVNLIHQVNHLVQDVQRHRGISMGLLAGNRAFEGDFYRLQAQIGRRLATMVAFSGLGSDLLLARDRENLELAWGTIRHDWEDDKLSDNFELHSHFIEQLFLLSGKLAKSLEASLVETSMETSAVLTVPADAFPRQAKQVELLNFTCALLPQMIETMAKIRGLASFSAAVGSAQYDHDRKLRFLVQCAREQNEILRQRAQRLHEVLGGDFNAKYVIGELETKFVHLIELVTHDVLSGQTIQSSSSQLFNLATDLIDKYWRIVDEGLNLLRLWQRRDLESWVTQ